MKFLFMSGNKGVHETQLSNKICLIGIQIEDLVFGLIVDKAWV